MTKAKELVDIVHAETPAPATIAPGGEISPGVMILTAIEKGLDGDAIGKLLDLRDRVVAGIAKESYYKAFAVFKGKCPPIEKKRIVKNKDGQSVRYRFANMDDICSQIDPILAEEGLSYHFETPFKDGAIAATCIVTHVQGHSERSAPFTCPVDSEAYMNDAQKAGSAATFAKRYALIDILGLTTSDSDDDADSLAGGATAAELWRRFETCMLATLENIDSIMAVKVAIEGEKWHDGVEVWCELNEETQMALWVAPKKGGPFTTAERKAMKAPEWTKVESAYKSEQSKQAAKGFGLPDDYGKEAE